MIIFIIVILVFLIVFLLWRLYSNRYLLPCPSWLSGLVELDNPLAPVHKAESIVKNLELRDGMKVLDVGCGPGRVMLPIAEAIRPNGTVTGIDVQLGMIEKAKKNADLVGLKNVQFLQGEIGKIPLDNNKYDRVLLVAVLGEIPDQERQKVLKNLFETLRPGGIASITEIIFDPHFQRRQRVIDLMLATGFVQKKSFGRWFAYTINFEKPLMNR
jgi:ubiquinone/menaquinone biosynthesis C-methylase UbiE